MNRWYKLAALVAGVATLAGVGASARVADAAPSANAPIKVGIVYSRTGAFAAYGAEYLSGLRLGLDYATRGTGQVNGRKIEFTFVDDGTDAAKAVSGAKDLIGQGYKILAGSVSSGAALAVAPLADAEQGPLHRRSRRPLTRSRGSTTTRSARAARSSRTSRHRRRI